MDPETRRRRAASFEEVAAAYERARPEYPLEAVRWLVGEEPLDVVDLAAGTGKLTRSLVELGHRVTAVEPLPAMRAELERAVPGVPALEGTAEQIPLGDASTDVVTVAQAFHWFEPERALPEIARVLRPGGVLGVISNARDESLPWIAELTEVIGSDRIAARSSADALAETALFDPVERAAFAHVQPLEREGLRDLVLSRSHCAIREPAEREEIFAAVDALFAANAVGGVLELPYETRCFRAHRA